LDGLAAVPEALKELDDYNVTLTGKGPPKLPAFTFDFKGTCDFVVCCCLHAEVVSTSDWHGDATVREYFGSPCRSEDRLGIYHNPNPFEVIEVPNAGCSRFWIEFEYGKMLFPRIEDRLDLIEPKILDAAIQHFGVKFAQGCRWGA